MQQHLLRGGLWGLGYGAFIFFIIVLYNNLQVLFAIPLMFLSKVGISGAMTLYQNSIRTPRGLLMLLGITSLIYGLIGGLVYGALRAKDYSRTHALRWTIGILVIIAIILLVISFKLPVGAPSTPVNCPRHRGLLECLVLASLSWVWRWAPASSSSGRT